MLRILGNQVSIFKSFWRISSHDFVPGDDPGYREPSKEELRVEPVSGIFQQLGRLQEDVGTVVKEKNEGADLELMLWNFFRRHWRDENCFRKSLSR